MKKRKTDHKKVGVIILKWMMENIRLVLKLVWFVVVFIVTCAFHFLNYGTEQIVNFTELTRNDFLFFMILLLLILPLLFGFKIKTPWIEFAPEVEYEEKSKKIENATAQYDKEIAGQSNNKKQVDTNHVGGVN